MGDQRVEDESVQYYVPNNTGESGDNSGTMCRPNPLAAGGSKVTKARRKKQVLDEDVFDRMVDKVGDLSNTIRKTNLHWTNKLSRCVYGHVEYDDTVLDTHFDIVFE